MIKLLKNILDGLDSFVYVIIYVILLPLIIVIFIPKFIEKASPSSFFKP
jgi:hypothetical protein